MAIAYEQAPDIRAIAEDVVRVLGWGHVDLRNVGFIRSRGSKARRTYARCHAMGKAMTVGMGRIKSYYVIEVIAERFDRLAADEREETVIHELMHIPRSFGGGFKHHNVVNQKTVKAAHETYRERKKPPGQLPLFETG